MLSSRERSISTNSFCAVSDGVLRFRDYSVAWTYFDSVRPVQYWPSARFRRHGTQRLRGAKKRPENLRYASVIIRKSPKSFQPMGHIPHGGNISVKQLRYLLCREGYAFSRKSQRLTVIR